MQPRPWGAAAPWPAPEETSATAPRSCFRSLPAPKAAAAACSGPEHPPTRPSTRPSHPPAQRARAWPLASPRRPVPARCARPRPPLAPSMRYEERATHAKNPLGRQLFELIARKKTNLRCVWVRVWVVGWWWWWGGGRGQGMWHWPCVCVCGCQEVAAPRPWLPDSSSCSAWQKPKLSPPLSQRGRRRRLTRGHAGAGRAGGAGPGQPRSLKVEVERDPGIASAE